MEREIVFTGIGGQGVQLMAKVLAGAAAAEGRRVMLFGVYGGMMRGGPSESTVVVGDDEIQTPPIVPHCWSILAMHPSGVEAVAHKLRAGGLFYANETLVHEFPRADVERAGVPATALAEKRGTIAGAGMVALGAFVAHTSVVGLESAIASMRGVLPPHRRERADANEELIRLGAESAAPAAPREREA